MLHGSWRRAALVVANGFTVGIWKIDGRERRCWPKGETKLRERQDKGGGASMDVCAMERTHVQSQTVAKYDITTENQIGWMAGSA